jgi:hypothetical protein
VFHKIFLFDVSHGIQNSNPTQCFSGGARCREAGRGKSHYLNPVIEPRNEEKTARQFIAAVALNELCD